MGKKREDEIISFFLYKETVMLICMLILFALNQYDLLSLFHLVLLGVLIFGELFLSAGKRRKTRVRSAFIKSFSNWISRKKRLLNLNGTYTVISGYGKERLFVSTEEIAKGSNETVIFEGEFQGRRVAVKRLLKDLHFVARKEVQHLIATDQHPNIVRFHGVKYDKDYVYLALERCICSLTDLISLHTDSLQNSGHHQAISMQNVNLWKSNGYPSALLLKLMRDMVNGLVHLHDLGVIHQDIKPQNVMIANGNGICAKLSDIGIGRSDKSSSPQNAAGSVSSGRGASEQKFHKRQRWTEDMYSLGCIFYFCLTRGGHPLDHHLNHDIKVKNNIVSLHLVDHIPEAVDLLSRLLHSNPAMRPKAFQVLHHPLFWDSEKRLSFLRDVSDRLKSQKSKGTKRRRSNILITLERGAKRTFRDGWDKNMESELIKDINRRKIYGYKYNSVQHLLRVVRNKLNHYHESPPEIKELLGPMPEGIDNYFSCRFPRLLMEVYEVVISNFRSEKCFEKYFGDDSVPIV